jgi:hypothetical protein
LTVAAETSDGTAIQGNCTFNNIRFTNLNQTSANHCVFRNSSSSSGSTITFNNCVFDNMIVYSDSNGGNFTLVVSDTSYKWTFNQCLWNNIKMYSSSLGTSNGPFRQNSSGAFTFTGCTLYFNESGSNAWQGLYNGQQAGVNVYKNSIFQNDGTSFPWDTRTSTPTISSLTYCSTKGITSLSTIFSGGTGNVTATDALFVDSVNGNFNLRPTSPLIDIGGL